MNRDALEEGKEDHLIERIRTDPFSVLGVLSKDHQRSLIRVYRPDQKTLSIVFKGKKAEMVKTTIPGVFELHLYESVSETDYQIYAPSGFLHYDPYHFQDLISKEEMDRFFHYAHDSLSHTFGGRLHQIQGIHGARFILWAPHAASVSVIGDFNNWDGRGYPMGQRDNYGIWELFIPGLQEKERYQFEIHTKQGHVLKKSDPFALESEKRPKRTSVLFDPSLYHWHDHKWLEKRRAGTDLAKPLNIYEVHLGSWKQENGKFLNYRELARELIPYLQEMRFTHIELLPITEHPLDESWGYQVSGYYAVTSRYGSPRDFQYFVDQMHQHDIGVIMDWVPGHFPTDDFSLMRFDGEHLFEYKDPRKGFHPQWNTLIFDYGKQEVANFLMSSACYFIEQMHIDGIRVDAVYSMLYLDFARKKGEWIPNRFGGNENLEAIAFLRKLNQTIQRRFPGVLVIAEDASSYSGVTDPEGLGFHLKWNMGATTDFFRFFKREYPYRKYEMKDLIHPMNYYHEARFLDVVSHDEVANNRKHLYEKMPGNHIEKLTNMRLFFTYFYAFPGKKLLFMGCELGQKKEWNVKEELPWELLNEANHLGVFRCIQALNHLYMETQALWEQDYATNGFSWVNAGKLEEGVIAFLRLGLQQRVLCIFNMSNETREQTFIAFEDFDSIQLLFDSDQEIFGGFGRVKKEIIREKGGFQIDLPPLTGIIFEVRI